LDGEFRAVGDAIEIISLRVRDARALDAFKALLLESYKRSLSPEDTQRRAAKLDPASGKAVEKIRQNPRGKWSASVLLLLLALAKCELNVEAKDDINDLIDQLGESSPGQVIEQIRCLSAIRIVYNGADHDKRKMALRVYYRAHAHLDRAGRRGR
jgi:hypothetical protein